MIRVAQKHRRPLSRWLSSIVFAVLMMMAGLMATSLPKIAYADDGNQITKDHDLCQVKTYAGLSLDDFKEKLAGINHVNAPNCKRNETLLLRSSPYASGEIIQHLLDIGADPNLIASDKCTAICRAAMWNNIDALNILLQNGSDLRIGKEIHGKTLDRLLYFSPKESAEVIANYVSINHESIDLNTWRVAIKRTDSIVIKALLKHHLPPLDYFVLLPVSNDESIDKIEVQLWEYAIVFAPDTETISLVFESFKDRLPKRLQSKIEQKRVLKYLFSTRDLVAWEVKQYQINLSSQSERQLVRLRLDENYNVFMPVHPKGGLRIRSSQLANYPFYGGPMEGDWKHPKNLITKLTQ